MAAHTLTYFGLGARGFVTRVGFRKAGVPFTDERLTFPQWGEYSKDTLPLGQLPALEIEGVPFKICQSLPLSAYACKLAGLYPTDPLEQLKADEIVAIVDELWNKGGATPKDEAKRVEYATIVAPKFLKALAARLGDDTYFAGAAEPQWADLWVYQYGMCFSVGSSQRELLDLPLPLLQCPSSPAASSTSSPPISWRRRRPRSRSTLRR